MMKGDDITQTSWGKCGEAFLYHLGKKAPDDDWISVRKTLFVFSDSGASEIFVVVLVLNLTPTAAKTSEKMSAPFHFSMWRISSSVNVCERGHQAPEP